MSRFTWLGAAALTMALGVAMPAAAQTEAETPAAEAQAQSPQVFTDAQVSAFAAASAEVDPISRTLSSATAEQRAEATTQIRAILERHNIDADTYNAIATQAQGDQALAARIRAAHGAHTPSDG
ncbi:MAG TPA: hypothetical protein PLS69_07815 [Terricaulis sp.]|nr:hypothetical protein [Terricaulis sp.]HRP10705.1 hypothetical protein [Terricaulis sp.]